MVLWAQNILNFGNFENCMYLWYVFVIFEILKIMVLWAQNILINPTICGVLPGSALGPQPPAPNCLRPWFSSTYRALYSNRGWRENKIENVVFEPVWRGKLFQPKVFYAAIDSAKSSSKSELSARFCGRLKLSALFKYLGLV